MNTILTGFKSFITSTDLNISKAPFFPKGRYYGFDILTSNQGVGNFIFGKISHDEVLEYLDKDNQLQEVGVVQTPHGVSYICNEDIPIQIPVPTNQDPTLFTYYIVVVNFLWVNVEPQDPPYISLVPWGPNLSTPSFEADPYAVCNSNQVVLGVIKVPAGATSVIHCTYTPEDHPMFAGSLEGYAKLADQNNFAKLIGLSQENVVDGDFTINPDLSYTWSLPNTNVVKVDLPNRTINITMLLDSVNPLYAGAAYLVHVIGIGVAGLKFTPGNSNSNNIEITNQVTFYTGDSFILLKSTNFKWIIIAGFNTLHKGWVAHQAIITDLALKSARAAYKDTLNIFQKMSRYLPEHVSDHTNIQGSTLLFGESVNQVLHHTEVFDVEVTAIAKAGLVEYVDGDLLFVTITGAYNTGHGIKLKLRPADGQGFIVSNYDLEMDTDYVILKDGLYVFMKNSGDSDHQWRIIAPEMSLTHLSTPAQWISLVNSGDGLAGFGTWEYLSYYIDTMGQLHIKGEFVLTSQLTGTVQLNLLTFTGKTLTLRFVYDSLSVYLSTKPTLDDNHIIFVGPIAIGRYTLEETVLSL